MLSGDDGGVAAEVGSGVREVMQLDGTRFQCTVDIMSIRLTVAMFFVVQLGQSFTAHISVGETSETWMLL